jgi:hypothetical protein
MTDPSSYRKFHIIGGAGTGKTTLGNWLANQLDCPHYDLDQVGWGPKGKVPLEQRFESVDRILKLSSWVTEGIFLWWTDPLLDAADAIVWLDLPFPLTAWRMVKRHILADLRGNNPHPGYGNLLKLVSHMAKQHYRQEPLEPAGPDDDFAVTRAATVGILRGYSEKVVHCRTQGNVESFRKQFI